MATVPDARDGHKFDVNGGGSSIWIIEMEAEAVMETVTRHKNKV